MQIFAVCPNTHPKEPVEANTGTDYLPGRLQKCCCRCWVVEISCCRLCRTSNTEPISDRTLADGIRGEFDSTRGDIQSRPACFGLVLLPFLCRRTSGNTHISRKKIIQLFGVIHPSFPVAALQVEDRTRVYPKRGPPRSSDHQGWKFRGAERVGEYYQAGMKSEKRSWSLLVISLLVLHQPRPQEHSWMSSYPRKERVSKETAQSKEWRTS